MAHHRAPRTDNDWTPPTFTLGVAIGLVGGILFSAILSLAIVNSWVIPLG